MVRKRFAARATEDGSQVENEFILKTASESAGVVLLLEKRS